MMNPPNNEILKKYVQIIFYISFLLFLYLYIVYSFQYYLTKYCFILCLMTGTSFLIRHSKYYSENN